MQQGLQERVKNCKRIRTDQRSVYLQRVQCQQLEQKLKQAEAWLLRLGQLARLIHYMICQSLVSIVEEEITSFVANILQVRWWVARVEVGRQSRLGGGQRALTRSPQPLLTLLYSPQGRNPFSQPSWSLTVVASYLLSRVLKL